MRAEIISRRGFLEKTVATVSLTLVPSIVLGSVVRKIAPSDKLNIAGIGIGGRGFELLKSMATENIVALCDVDWKYSEKCFSYFPKAKRYWDWRKILDETDNSIDAVVIATPDHTHAIIASNAMVKGKHVYCETPLAHSIYESRLLCKLAKKYKVITQTESQFSSGDGVHTICEWIGNNEIGEVKKVEVVAGQTTWSQGMDYSERSNTVPDSLNWDLFVGPASMRPYHAKYTAGNWRNFWDFGTGTLGNMGHVLHPVFAALKLQNPVKIQGSSTCLSLERFPNAQIVRFLFPERMREEKIKLPEVEVLWYDGGLQPMKPQGWPAGKNIIDAGGGVIFHGTRDTLICGCYGKDPWLLSGRIPVGVKKPLQIYRENHKLDWIRACKENPQQEQVNASLLSLSVPLNETILTGVIAIRLQGLNRELEWDSKNMRFSNIPDENIVIDSKTINAQQFANELIRHTYRQGWTLPEMPV